MEVKFIDNQETKLASILVAQLRKSLDTRIAVAFMSNGGLSLLEDAIAEASSKGGKTEMLIGLDFTTTEARALWKLHHWAKANKNFKFYCLPLGGSNIYHPKMYLMSDLAKGSIVVGSSNLTAAGLTRNAEANIFIEDKADSEVFTDAQASYVRLKFDGRRIPSEQFLSTYEDKSNKLIASKRKDPTKELRTLFSSLEKEFSSLPKPKPTSRDLVGWIKLVYEVLPDGEFVNDDVYKNEKYFKSYYPENQNIRAKTRQQLQFLRDLGFIKSKERGVWQKVKTSAETT